MEIILSTEAIRTASDRSITILAIAGYIIGAIFYSLIKDRFAGKLLAKHIYILGNVSRATHLLSYMFLGYIFPDRFVFIMILGVIWELIECIMSTIMRDNYWGEGQDYMCDIVANAIGFLIGYGFYCCGDSGDSSVV